VAEDLIPKRDSSGPIGEDANPKTPDIIVPPSSQETLVEQRSGRGRIHPYRLRFGLAYLVLAAIVGGAIGSFVVLVMRDPPAGEGVWSSWQPVGRESSFPRQIADHVSGNYRLPSGSALVGVIASKPEVHAGETKVPVSAVAIQNDPEGDSDDITIVRADGGLMYQLCGLGEGCAIKEGTPSEARHRLLRREALELALYTFKYVDGVESVITLLPPHPEAESATALFFQKKDLEDALDRPLEETLRSKNPPRGMKLDPTEGLTVDRLTNPRLFQYEFTQAPAGGAILVLAPVQT
jgi:hypothetical protein